MEVLAEVEAVDLIEVEVEEVEIEVEEVEIEAEDDRTKFDSQKQNKHDEGFAPSHAYYCLNAQEFIY